MTKLTPQPKLAIDMLEDEGLVAFFDLKAELAYFCSIQGASNRRDRHPDIIPLFERWFAVDAPRRREIISEHVIKRRNKRARAPDTRTILRSLWTKAEDFFSPTDLQSAHTLKAAYRKAVKVCHPDAGGNHEDMVALNDAFENLHEMIVNNWFHQEVEIETADRAFGALGPIAFDPNDLTPSAARPFKNPEIRDGLIAKLWLQILVDEWNLDAAAAVMGNASLFAKFLEVGPEIERAELLETIGTMIDRCFALNRADICDPLIAGFSCALDNSINDYPSFRHLQMIRDRFVATRDGKKRRVILNHHRQQENADRLSGRLPSNKHEALNDLAATPSSSPSPVVSNSFLQLPYDPPLAPRPADPFRIPFPTRYEPPSQNYSSAQRWEYHQAFYNDRSLKLIEKHKWARAWSSMLSLVLSDVHPEGPLEELKSLGELFPNHLDHLSKAAIFLKAMDAKEMRARLRDLRELDSRARNHAFPEPPTENRWYEPKRLIVGVDSSYVQTVTADAEEMALALRTGCITTAKEQHDIGRQWARMSNFLDAQRSNRNKTLVAIKRKDDETIVKLKTAYIDSCLNVAPKMMAVAEEFQICYSYDKLTSSLIRLGRWQEARDRLQQLFLLPEIFFRRSSPSEQQLLRKRLERCEKESVPS